MEGSERISARVIEDEMKEAYMAYAMSVIVGRALPRVEDGLKPVHRRILYAMHDMGMRYNQPFKKCARIVGEVLGKYHPHGDSAVYDALVRMVQDFSLRQPLINGQGNFGSIDGDGAAAMRYTEARLQKISQELLTDLEKETVDWTENFDGSLSEPSVLPSTLPTLLINGASGIAVGMATNMPPHNLAEVADAIIAYQANEDVTVQELLEHIPGPDFPTGGVICGRNGILQAYSTGRGKVILRGVIEREEKGDQVKLIITEIPYQVVKADLIIQIADLVKDGRVEGIRDIRDESDRRGIRVVIDLKRDASPDIVENSLFKYSRLQQTFGIINLAIVNGQPQVLRLPELLHHYLRHRTTVIERRTQYDLRKAEERAHILEGLLIALTNIDDVVPLIRNSSDSQEAQDALIEKYELSEEQAKAILAMTLSKLTNLESGKIEDEHKELLETIADLKDILAKPERVQSIIKEDLHRLKDDYATDRRTKITDAETDIDLEDLIDPEDMVVTISHQGYIKRLSLDTYQAQRRGGRGIIGATTKEDDFVEHLFVANTHSYLLFFTNKGEVYWKKVYHIPETSRTAKGTPIVNLVEKDKDETISAVIPVKEFREDQFLVFATKNGYIKKTDLSAYSRPRTGGIHAIKLDEGDDLVRVVLTNGERQLMLASKKGQAVRFDENDVRGMGRVSRGVRGMRLRPNDEVIDLVKVSEDQTIITVTENGYGKRSDVADYRLQSRGGLGVRNILCSPRNGPVSAVRVVEGSEELLLISQKGIMIRTRAEEIRTMGRSTQGVRIMNLRDGDKVSSIAKVITDDDEPEEIEE